MKIKSIFAFSLAALVLSACSKDGEYEGPEVLDGSIAYVSIQVATQSAPRSSSDEDPGLNESDIKTLYLLTFDNSDVVVGVPGSSNFFVKIDPASDTPEAQKVSAKAKKLLVIANPGTKLIAALNSITASMTFDVINNAIIAATAGEITDDVSSITKGFTMINCGNESGLSVNQKITDPLIDISNDIHQVTETVSEAQAKGAAEASRVSVKIERLAAKIELMVASPVTTEQSGAKFTFGNWTLDGLNSTFYPFAEKTILSVTHSTIGGFYVNNFYTQDPNFISNTGIDYATIGSDYKPVLPQGGNWLAASTNSTPVHTYSIENTMAAAQQTFENATRIVIKATYYPVASWSGDWFSFAGINYETLGDLQTAYNDAASGSNLKAACDKMFAKIDNYIAANSTPGFTATDFASLSTGDLALIPDNLGGEITKDGKNAVVRWYQGGLNYYYYEIRHYDTTDLMAFGKYGVVRNNWYSLTLGSVSGPGTPWYPDINNPGPGDPDPTDPIDEGEGFLGIKVEVAPWIIWSRTIGI